jgi:hypothetical protein
MSLPLFYTELCLQQWRQPVLVVVYWSLYLNTDHLDKYYYYI